MSFNPAQDIPSLKGKVILITGGNVGLGKQAALEFARHDPRQIWIACRNLEKAQAAADQIKAQVPGAPIELLELDLTSFESVQKAAATFKEKSDRLDILMLNAGIMATLPDVTKEGYEIQFGTNHMGHALLTKLLLPVLETTAKSGGDVRVVSLSSFAHTMWKRGDFDFQSLKTPAEPLGAWGRYARSKLANILWARQLAERYPQFTVASVHPGVVQSSLFDRSSAMPGFLRGLGKVFERVIWTRVEEGVKGQVWAAVSGDVKSGEYYTPVGVTGQASAQGKDEGLAREVWEWTEKELEGYSA